MPAPSGSSVVLARQSGGWNGTGWLRDNRYATPVTTIDRLMYVLRL